MNRFATSLTVIAIVSATSAAYAAPDREVAVSKAAAQLGYSYGYLGPEDAVQLSRPGVTIVLRPGEVLFDVNDRTESMNGPAPRFAHDDLYISHQLYERLRSIALAYRMPAPPAPAPAATPEPDVTGSITKLTVTQVLGQQLLAVNGAAPAGAPVTLTLTATFSNEIADVVLSRTLVSADAQGKFEATVPIAPGYFRGAVLTVAASSVPGVTAESTHLVLKPVNHGVVVPADLTPKGIR